MITEKTINECNKFSNNKGKTNKLNYNAYH